MNVISPDDVRRGANGSLLGLASRQDHFLSSKDGYMQICQLNANSLIGNKGLFQVFKKRLVWFEA